MEPVSDYEKQLDDTIKQLEEKLLLAQMHVKKHREFCGSMSDGRKDIMVMWKPMTSHLRISHNITKITHDLEIMQYIFKNSALNISYKRHIMPLLARVDGNGFSYL